MVTFPYQDQRNQGNLENGDSDLFANAAEIFDL